MMFTHNKMLELHHIQHAFFSRKGGYSSDVYDSLNCGYGTKYSRENIQKNYDYVHHMMDSQKLLTLKQIHSNKVITVTEPWTLENRPEADAMVTNIPHITVGILTADCGPLILSDKEKNIIGAAHLGRKGTFTGLLFKTVDAMVKLGATRTNIVAVLGPTISKENYEVGIDVLDDIMDKMPEYKRHLYNITDKKDQFLLDLPRLIAAQAQDAGIDFFDLQRCTYAEEEYFFSYRRTTHKKEEDFGRLLSAIHIRPTL